MLNRDPYPRTDFWIDGDPARVDSNVSKVDRQTMLGNPTHHPMFVFDGEGEMRRDLLLVRIFVTNTHFDAELGQ